MKKGVKSARRHAIAPGGYAVGAEADAGKVNPMKIMPEPLKRIRSQRARSAHPTGSATEDRDRVDVARAMETE